MNNKADLNTAAKINIIEHQMNSKYNNIMKKIILLLTSAIFFSIGISAEVESGSTIETTKPETSMPMNAAPTTNSESIQKEQIQKVDQPKQEEQLVGSNSSTWTPAYLKVKKFKKCLSVEDYRGWEGYCLPSKQPEKCPNESWKKLSEMNLIPCTTPSK